ncbi:MAG: uroporphyrinogen-III synthase [Minwuia sp.]|uniref:uroporphyrinogen-III synthase n=1 Tax=Minwuia sp. TaxID=2493630 RepID=UPI003A88ECED
MRVLVTRPRDDAEDTARRLADLGHEVLIEPVLDIRFLRPASVDLAGFQAFLATSRNGVRALVHAGAPRNMPLMAVGRSTAALARESGFVEVHDADGDVQDLAALVQRRLKPDGAPLFHAAGSDRTGDLRGELEVAGYSVRREALYEAVQASAFSPEAEKALKYRQIDAVLFFSPRSAEAFARLALPNDGVRLACGDMAAICISERTVRSLHPLSFRDVRVAGRPNQDALMACLPAIGGERDHGRPE